MRHILLIILLLTTGCTPVWTKMNLKGSVGSTEYDNGSHALYTGASAEFQFDIRH